MTRSSASLSVFRTALCLSVLAAPAAAHDRTTSYSTWDIHNRAAHVTVRLSAFDLSRLPWMTANGSADEERALHAYLTTHLQLLAGDAPCAVSDGPRRLDTAPGRVVYEWRVACTALGALQIRSRLLLDVAPAHLHFARVSRDGAPALERVLSEREPTWGIGDGSGAHDEQPAGTSLLGYIVLGIEHIWTGYDHLVFLLALLLIGGTLGEIAQVVTGFTVAHSVTLALTVLGYVRPEPGPVEALIGLSIALVAAENLWLIGPRSSTVPRLIAAALALLALDAAAGHGRVPALTLTGLALFALCYFGLLRRVSSAASLRWGIAFIFGLVHGFGFASVLVQAELPTERLVQALFGFNVGVEVGQLAAVAFVWPLLRAIAQRSEAWRVAVLHYGSAAVLGLGVFWFVNRTFG